MSKMYGLLFAIVLMCPTAFASDSVSAIEEKQPVLVDSHQMTVYVFDKDAIGVSNCYNGCARAWPAVLGTGSTIQAPYSVISRTDGTSQLAYKGRPLYTYVGDSNPGDETGDGIGGIWHVVLSQ